MRQFVSWRTLIALSVIVPFVARGQVISLSGYAADAAAPSISSHVHAGGLSSAEVQRLAQNATKRVIVILRNQHPALPARSELRASRRAAVQADQAPILSELAQLHAPRVNSYHIINAIAATVSAAEAARLASNPAVRAIVPDGVVQGPPPPQLAPAGLGVTPNSVISPCAFMARLEPEALQLTNTAFEDPSVPQAQNYATGAGVTVAFLADGLDPNNPDFIRPDGSHVFVDYQDFSGDGPNAPTDGREAFGDASSIAAQGNETYNVNDFVNNAHRRTVACPQIKILGMAPGASLMGLKVFGQTHQSFTSNFVQAIQYAIDHSAKVINESFGANPYPDNANDPISLANDAAVAAGVTVVVSSGDAGTEHTIGSPATDPNVISSGATTQFRVYSDTVASGFQLGNGDFVDNNISSFSSAGPAQSARQTVDAVAPGDLGWALCSPNTAIYLGCTDYNNNPSPIQVFGGTSESAPLMAGEAALIIEAYRNTHGGACPSPALVKQIMKSTATDLHIPSYEQGAGLINSLKAVQAAMSYKDANGSPTPQGDALLTSPGTLSATDVPGTTETFTIQVTNVSSQTQTVTPSIQTLGAPTPLFSGAVTLDPGTDPTFVDEVGRKRAYVEQDFTVPAGAQRLDAAIAWDVRGQETGSPVRLTLFDAQNRFVAFSNPQDPGAPFFNSGYGHVDVRFPTAGTWRAIIWTRANSTGYKGTVQLSVSTSNFVPAGTVTPKAQALAPGATGSFVVHTSTPAQPGDESANVFIGAVGADGMAHDAGDIPVILRSLVPLGANGGSFTGTLTGGNGRFLSPGQTLTYQFDVPAGLKDLDLNTSITDTTYNLEGVLVDPNGSPIDVQSTVTATVAVTTSAEFGQPSGYTNTLQFFRRDPQPGRWQFVFFINDTSGPQTSIPFTATIVFNGVQVTSNGVPSDTGTTIPQGSSMTAQITVTNTGNTAKDFFVDPRLAQYELLSLGGTAVPLPVPVTVTAPAFLVPPESTNLTIAAESMAPTVPISMDIYNLDGAPPYGFTNSPDIEGTSFFYPFTGHYAALATSSAPEVAPGVWGAGPTEVGPYPDSGAVTSTAQLGATAFTQQFDSDVTSSTGDGWAILAGQSSGPYAPLTLAPGESGTIDVTFTPSAAPGTAVNGFLYVDAFNANSAAVGDITFSGDELKAIPYAYTVGEPAATGTPTSTATATATETTPATGTATPTSTATATSTATSTSTSTATATPVATGTEKPTETASGHVAILLYLKRSNHPLVTVVDLHSGSTGARSRTPLLYDDNEAQFRSTKTYQGLAYRATSLVRVDGTVGRGGKDVRRGDTFTLTIQRERKTTADKHQLYRVELRLYDRHRNPYDVVHKDVRGSIVVCTSDRCQISGATTHSHG